MTTGTSSVNGVGTLTINNNAQVYGAAIDLSGADVNIDPTATVGSAIASAGVAATAQVTIQSSVESRPMQIGGTNNAAVAGINLTSAELGRIVTASTGTMTFGDDGRHCHCRVAGGQQGRSDCS
jgi:hypothetical protein